MVGVVVVPELVPDGAGVPWPALSVLALALWSAGIAVTVLWCLWEAHRD